jgi:polyphosphate glucokinase
MQRVLVVDVGGSHVKALVSGVEELRRFPSGPRLRADRMAEKTIALVEGWDYDVVSIGIPAPVQGGKVIVDPVNLGRGWVGFDFEEAFGRPTRVVNDAAMQALGSYDRGKVLFLGLGTGLGSALVMDGLVLPMELGHMPFRKGTFEGYVGRAALDRRGKKRWRKDVAEVVATLASALAVDDVVLGGGNVDKLDELPPNVRIGGNDNAFVGGFRLWDPNAPARIP